MLEIYNKVPSPCYVLEKEQLIKNLKTISHVANRAEVEIILAFKGFAMWSVFPLMKKYIRSAAASSLNEARLAFEEMKTFAHTYAPAYSPDEFGEIIKYSSHITFNSLKQFYRFYPEIKKFGKKISVGLRVNPEYSTVKTALYNPASRGSRLGVPVEHLANGLPEEIEGLHFHSLCESSSYDLEILIQKFEAKFAKFLPHIKWVNMGGGHLMTRDDYNTEHLIALLKAFRKKHELQVILEPGSAFAWKTGVLVATVLDIVENHGIKTAIMNVSFTAHMPDCLEMPYKPKIQKAVEQSDHCYRIGGNSCLAGDYLGEWCFAKPLKAGDKLIFDDMMHYTMVKTNMFNGVKHPSIGILNDKKEFLMIREFAYSDYRNRLS